VLPTILSADPLSLQHVLQWWARRLRQLAHPTPLLANGKPKMTAVVACMRKLVTLLNAILKQNTEWKPR
jgi:hypothetical protein